MNWRLPLVGIVVVVVAGCGEKSDSSAQASSASNAPSSGNPLTAPVDYLGAVGAAQRQAERTLDLSSLNQAVRAFQAGEDRLPSSLQELVSEGYLPRLPSPPRGMQFAYNPQSGQVSVRSVPGAAPAAPTAPARKP